MKNLIRGLAIGSSIIIASQAAQAKDNFYVSGALGATFTQDADYRLSNTTGDFEIDNTVNFSLAAGKHLNKNIRTELELSHRKADLDVATVDGVVSLNVGGDISTTTILLNGYYSFLPDQAISPYFSGGVGFAKHDATLTVAGLTGSGDDTVFAYQVGGGADYKVDNNVTLFTDYRYFGSSDAKFVDTEVEYNAHELRAGVRYSF